jgi:hypothetical protein
MSEVEVVTSGSKVVDISPKHPAQLMGPVFSQTVLAVLFALTFEKALEVQFDAVRAYSSISEWWATVHAAPGYWTLSGLQLFAFLATLFRFYAGSYRFHQEPPETTTMVGTMIDLVGTAILFIGFYIAAELVMTTGLFLLFVGVFHVIDLAWFILGGAFTTHRAHVQTAIRHYLAYDFITILLVALVAIWYHASPFQDIYLKAASAVILLGMFVIDVLWRTRDWYFDPEKWARAHNVSRP